jgi:hypothetical protein
LNLQLLAPKASALPDCATFRYLLFIWANLDDLGSFYYTTLFGECQDIFRDILPVQYKAKNKNP